MNPATQTTEADAPVIVRLDEVTPRKVLWLWHHRIPRGKLTLIAGDGGIGKSLLTMDIAQRVSSGRPWPDSLCEPNPAGGVVIMSVEDDIDDTIVPRLKAAGADLTRCVAIHGVEFTDDNRKGRGIRGFNLQHDMPVLQEAIETTKDCSLVIIDPATAYMGNVRGNDNVEVRGCLAPLAALAADTGVAVILVTHLNKPGAASNTTAAHRIIGSIAFSAAARATWLVCRDEEPSQRRLLLPVKWNLCAEPTGLAYEIHPYEHDAEIPVLHWQSGAVTIRADEALSVDRREQATAVDEAVDWLREALSDGPVESKELVRQAKEAAISERTLWRGKEKAGVVARPSTIDGKKRWHWSLHGQVCQTPPHWQVATLAALADNTIDTMPSLPTDRNRIKPYLERDNRVGCQVCQPCQLLQSASGDDSDRLEAEATIAERAAIQAVEGEAERSDAT